MKDNNLNKRILKKVETKIAISNFEKEDTNMTKSKILKMVATFVLTIGITTSLVYAGSKVYEKIFKEPEKIENFIEELKVSEEDLKNIITEQEAKESAKKEIKRFGLELKEEDITKTEIKKSPNYDEITYVIETPKLQINIDAKTGKLTNFNIEDGYSLEEIETFTSSKEEIIEVAKNKLKEYGFGEEYKLSYISCNNGDDEEKAYFWYLWFSKEYDGLFNPAQTIALTIIPKVNLVTSFSITDEPFDNNEVVISEEEAINIAKEKEKIINTENYKVEDCKAELAIKRMNPEVYLKENNLTRGNETVTLEDGTKFSYNTYKMNGRARRVYVVEFSYSEEREFGQKREIYVDATTGEVVGGDSVQKDLSPIGH